MRTPASILTDALSSDATRPRITVYDDTAGAAGERVELSARVMANWVAKAANALQEEWDAAPGTRVRLALPPHWRTLYWALATWSVGGCVDLRDSGDLTVSDDPAALTAGSPGVLVTLAALARSAPTAPVDGAMDEARELATYADQFSPWEEPAGTDPALADGTTVDTYGTVLDIPPVPRGSRVHLTTADTSGFLRSALAALAADGSIVLSRGRTDPEVLARRLSTEGVTLDLG